MILQGRVAVVTGAAGALGLAAARALLEDGARVAFVDLDALRLDGLSRFVRGDKVVIPCDVTDAEAVRAAHDRVRADLGPVDILVNAAGYGAQAPTVAGADESVWRRVLASRLQGAFLWSRAVLPEMSARGWGRIVSVGGAESAALPGPAEAAAAGGVAAFTRALAREAAPRGVTANAIAPAFVRSPTATDTLSEAQRRQVLAAIPAGRFGEPEEFAHAVRFLVSPLAGFVTGEVLSLDGGLHLN